MKIEHLAIWVQDLESMRNFYSAYFNAVSGDKYENPAKEFTSYFLSFSEGCRLELMYNPKIADNLKSREERVGLTHFAIAVGSKEKVDALTGRLENNGFKVLGIPRTTGDGYYESVVADPEGNRIEITT